MLNLVGIFSTCATDPEVSGGGIGVSGMGWRVSEDSVTSLNPAPVPTSSRLGIKVLVEGDAHRGEGYED